MASSFETPFGEKTKKHHFERNDFEAYHENIRELPSRKDKIIRAEPFRSKSVEDEVGFLKETKGLLGYLQEHGIDMPAFDVVIGKDEKGRKRVFSIVDKIEGERVSKIKEYDSILNERLDKLFANYLRYLKDCYFNKKAFYADMSDLQLVYGHSKDSVENKIYLVDLGFNDFIKPSNGNREFGSKAIFHAGVIRTEVEEFKNRFPSADFPETLKTVTRVQGTIQEDMDKFGM